MLMPVSNTCRVWMDEVERKGVVHVKHGSCLRLQVVASGETAKHNKKKAILMHRHTQDWLHMSFICTFTQDLPEI